MTKWILFYTIFTPEQGIQKFVDPNDYVTEEACIAQIANQAQEYKEIKVNKFNVLHSELVPKKIAITYSCEKAVASE